MITTAMTSSSKQYRKINPQKIFKAIYKIYCTVHDLAPFQYQVVSLRKFVKRNLPGLASMKGREPTKDVQSKPPSFMNARVENCP
ncbi:uncharacterized protein LOC136031723 isoform X2 [Artemia franciscana]|uniref:uncharacterized protein LOC136031723 isoform X2 n=1 Tax=Artemia franciscana TaxID=6661 RepID=UPI0032D9B7F5